MKRIEIRTYYRKNAGIFSLLNAWLALMVSGLAIYLSEFEELDPEVVSGASELVMNGLYAVFAMGAIWAVFALIVGIWGLAGNGEGVFSFLRFESFLMVLFMLFSAFLSVQILTNPEMEWTTERRVMTILYLILSVLAAAAGILVFFNSIQGMKYYDRGKKLAKDAPDMPPNRMRCVTLASHLLCGLVFTVSAAFMGFYFNRMILSFDEQFVLDNGLFSVLFLVLFLLGIVLVLAGGFVIGTAFFKNRREKQIRLLAVLNGGYLLLFALISVWTMGQKFVKSQYPSADYIIFTILLCILGIAFLLPATGLFQKR